MPHSFGKKARTRDMFAKPFRRQGEPALSKYLITYRVGDIVDVKADGSIHKGMPYKYYHGRTGVVYNVTKTSVGVELQKPVKHRLITKRINVRIEHVSPSNSRKEFLNRVKDNELKKKAARAEGKKALTKRQPRQPKEGYVLAITEENEPVTMRPIPFEYNL
uniref:60S ribosomal protein L21 n=1 Tax=Aplanochytrium stocchinoi TaxID=215587 RepID=A0A7S3V3E0_9STRA|mmetsp:Transcript_3824/g.4764  ORF Transcript_3824/g.4764 Transcript_3824/m.4764 type:complete len:162 (-) Transcript_3824:325-810(-)|eukprot:CAMPEP_0204854346 /NCGR_PEP_ID=MMETSP1347-20130617/15049_1 /ASSEMBLY_ACC=CAM_ASM_000690 /TAXON_ID=215587 /ORGANISM="Aplanochytrium stocchinoi, Strain GSBS06" /LENGTH=161 /DNA_ID=CAMNT_0051999873 /DNA_START=51 /DNA_END=536 /DNA_ORIENTATION=+